VKPVQVPTTDVNSETGLLLAWHAGDRSKIEAGETIAEIETSKATGGRRSHWTDRQINRQDAARRSDRASHCALSPVLHSDHPGGLGNARCTRSAAPPVGSGGRDLPDGFRALLVRWIVNLELRMLCSLMDKMDRNDPIGEATFSALETATLLISFTEPPSGGVDFGGLELLRQALGAARASVVATSYALTASADAERMRQGSHVGSVRRSAGREGMP
jgi:hypothetical protein